MAVRDLDCVSASTYGRKVQVAGSRLACCVCSPIQRMKSSEPPSIGRTNRAGLL